MCSSYNPTSRNSYYPFEISELVDRFCTDKLWLTITTFKTIIDASRYIYISAVTSRFKKLSADTRDEIRWDWLYHLLSLFYPAPEGRRKECRLSNRKCQAVVKVSVVKRAVGDSGLSNIKQSTDVKECWALHSCPLARGCCHMTLWPPPAVEESHYPTSHLCRPDKRRSRW